MAAAGRRGGGGQSRSGSGKGRRGGFGQGQRGGSQRNMPPGVQRGAIDGACVCPSCGATVPHERGIPCTGNACPQCGKPMVRE